MTRKDYIELARIFHEHMDEIGEASELLRSAQATRVRRIVKDLLPVLKSDNRNFSADKFLVACGFAPTEGY